jgi:hypothetical protein
MKHPPQVGQQQQEDTLELRHRLLPSNEEDKARALRQHQVQQKGKMQACIQGAQASLRELQVSLRNTIPNAEGLVLMKDIEKSQRQMEKLMDGLQRLVV